MSSHWNPGDIMSLSAPERLLLAQHLVDSVLAEAMPLSSDQMAEVRRRAEAIDAGAPCQSWESIRDALMPRR